MKVSSVAYGIFPYNMVQRMKGENVVTASRTAEPSLPRFSPDRVR